MPPFSICHAQPSYTDEAFAVKWTGYLEGHYFLNRFNVVCISNIQRSVGQSYPSESRSPIDPWCFWNMKNPYAWSSGKLNSEITYDYTGLINRCLHIIVSISMYLQDDDEYQPRSYYKWLLYILAHHYHQFIIIVSINYIVIIRIIIILITIMCWWCKW